MASKMNGVDDWVRAPPPKGAVWQRAAYAIYNPEKKSFLGRTPKRWGIVLTFYLVFYAVLALLFGICMGGLFLSINRQRPAYTLQHSLIGANPGVAARPLLDGAVLSYKTENETSYEHFVEHLQDFFIPYITNIWYLEKRGCKSDDNFGYPETPCFFIKVNKVFDWKPDYYDVADLPDDMPEDLKEHIKGLDTFEQKQVWISCAEEHNTNDTTFEYPWGRGLPAVFYPYVNVDGYKSPLVAVKLTPPVNLPVTIRCRAWAKNIIYNKSLKEPSGYTRFQLHIVDGTTTATTDALT